MKCSGRNEMHLLLFPSLYGWGGEGGGREEERGDACGKIISEYSVWIKSCNRFQLCANKHF